MWNNKERQARMFWDSCHPDNTRRQTEYKATLPKPQPIQEAPVNEEELAKANDAAVREYLKALLAIPAPEIPSHEHIIAEIVQSIEGHLYSLHYKN